MSKCCLSSSSSELVGTSEAQGRVAAKCCLRSSTTESASTAVDERRVAAKSSRCYSGASIGWVGTTDAESRVATMSECCLSSSSTESTGTFEAQGRVAAKWCLSSTTTVYSVKDSVSKRNTTASLECSKPNSIILLAVTS
ncbi:hypothetical protein PR001_g32751 [Phytophthora rubi]|uniref:Uncharacterized protein n=1 Tax=Phytophthora rubi TaxID=129364 RepID=A0A6A3GA72_9STRA|nr:hypothetical protein PR001_g32751 [Phytophthora rubi]